MKFIPLESSHQDESNGGKIISLRLILAELRYNKVLSIILAKIMLIFGWNYNIIQSTPSIVTPVIITFYYIVTPVECSKHFIIKIYPI